MRICYVVMANTESTLIGIISWYFGDNAEIIKLPTNDLEGNAVHKLLQIMPDIVIAGGDQEFVRRATLYAAEYLGIPTLVLQIGINSDTHNRVRIATKRTAYRLLHHGSQIIRKYMYLLRTVQAAEWGLLDILKMIIKDIRIAFSVDDFNGGSGSGTIAVSGIWDKRTIISRGANPDRIVITGNPMIGKAHKLSVTKLEALKSSLGIPARSRILLLLTCAQVEHGFWSTDRRTQFLSQVIDSVNPYFDLGMHMIIKIHPMENIEDYQFIRSSNITVVQDVSLTGVIQISDLVMVGGYSTTVLDAAVLRKPVLLLNLFNEVVAIPYEKMGIALEVDSAASLHYHIGDITQCTELVKLLKRNTESFLKDNKELVDGKAMERLGNLITALVSKRKQL